MGIFTTSLVLILIGFTMFYPIFFYRIDRSVDKNKGTRHFLQLNYVIHVLTGSMAVLLFWIYGINYPLQLSGVVYLIVIIAVVLYYWKSSIPRWNLFGASLVFGLLVFYRSFNEIVEITPLWPGIFTGILSAGAVSIVTLLIVSLFHTSIRKNEKKELIISLVKYLSVVIGIRLTWDLVVLFNISVETRNGELMSALMCFLQVDSLKLILLILFGLTVPALLYILFRKYLFDNLQKYKLWIFLILFISIWITEFLYKYFLLQYGIVL